MSMYAVVSNDSLVVKYVEAGDIEGLQRLFSAGEAIPYMICIQKRNLHNRETPGAKRMETWFERGNLLEVCKRFIFPGHELI